MDSCVFCVYIQLNVCGIDQCGVWSLCFDGGKNVHLCDRLMCLFVFALVCVFGCF